MILLLEVTIKASLILSATLVLLRLLPGQSAATRHWILASAVFSVAVIPVATWILPDWNVGPPIMGDNPIEVSIDGRLEAGSAAAIQSAPMMNTAHGARGTWPQIIWFFGFLVAFAGLGAASLRLLMVSSHSAPIMDGPWAQMAASVSRCYGIRRKVRLLRSPNHSVLVTWGVLRPAVLLPADAQSWPEERIHAVLHHELAHVRRFDWPIQIMAEILRAIYWFNPLMWIACKQLRLESELACDDAVIAQGLAGSKYAACLLDVLRKLQPADRTWPATLTMARSSTIERRFKAMLNPNINRREIKRPGMLAAVILSFGIMLPIAAISSSPIPETTTPEIIVAGLELTVPAAATKSSPVGRQDQSGRIIGSVSDLAGQRVAGATVVISTPEGRTQATTATNAQGAFAFSGLPRGSYVLQAFAVGFAPSQVTSVDLPGGGEVRRDIKMDIGFVKSAETPSPSPTSKQYAGEIVSLDLRDVGIHDFFRLLGDVSRINFVLDPSISGTVSVRLIDVPWDQILDTILKNHKLRGERDGSTMQITRDSAGRQSITLNLELYRNGSLIGAPRLTVLEGATGTLTQNGDFTINLTPARMPDGKILVEFSVDADKKAAGRLVVTPGEKALFSTQSVSGFDVIETRIVVTPNP